MDSWPYLESPVAEQNHTKPRLHPGDDLTALTMLYEQCKVDNVDIDKQTVTQHLPQDESYCPRTIL